MLMFLSNRESERVAVTDCKENTQRVLCFFCSLLNKPFSKYIFNSLYCFFIRCINSYFPNVLQFFLIIFRMFRIKNRRKTKAMMPLTQQYVCPVVNPVQKEKEFQTKRIVEQIVEINNELKLLMIVTSIQNVSSQFIIVYLIKQI